MPLIQVIAHVQAHRRVIQSEFVERVRARLAPNHEAQRAVDGPQRRGQRHIRRHHLPKEEVAYSLDPPHQLPRKPAVPFPRRLALQSPKRPAAQFQNVADADVVVAVEERDRTRTAPGRPRRSTRPRPACRRPPRDRARNTLRGDTDCQTRRCSPPASTSYSDPSRKGCPRTESHSAADSPSNRALPPI